MAKIRTDRVLTGGIVAGFVILLGEYVLNGVILLREWERVRVELAVPATGLAELFLGGLLSVFYGIVLVWLYAAMQPRFATVQRTTLMAALTFWTVAYVLFLLSLLNGGFVSLNIALASIGWGLIEVLLAAVLGVKIYHSGQDRSGSGRPVDKQP